MKKNPAIDLLEALRASVVPTEVPPGYYTLKELRQQTGMDASTLGRRLKSMGAECRLFKVKTGLVTRPVPHYRLAALGPGKTG